MSIQNPIPMSVPTHPQPKYFSEAHAGHKCPYNAYAFVVFEISRLDSKKTEYLSNS